MYILLTTQNSVHHLLYTTNKYNTASTIEFPQKPIAPTGASVPTFNHLKVGTVSIYTTNKYGTASTIEFPQKPIIPT